MSSDTTQRLTDGPDDGGATIGPFRLLSRLGQGGMGEVWLAEQTVPVRRRVALKIIKGGLDTPHFIARFEAERQALALMDHPGIARVFEAGTMASGRPYLAMELVQGRPIHEYCDAKRLTTRRRVELFLHVCDAVQHAHQKAVIHRDLKPSNILVTEIDDRPQPKIIDFGLAKALAQPLTERTLRTEFGALVGTLAYMSPEQVDSGPQGVDTRADVYSLGVVLYELLVGALPFDLEALRAAGLAAILRHLNEQDPPRPSARLRGLDGVVSSESAHRRGVDAATLRRQLAGDLDWIVLAAIERDRTRRYGSPQELAQDIRRYLADRPLSARPSRLVYRTAKFVRRNKRGLLAAAATLILLLAFAGVLSWQSRRFAATRERAQREADLWLQRMTSLLRLGGGSPARGDLDGIAPPGDGPRNAATWFSDFARPDGRRLAEAQAARQRVLDHANATGRRPATNETIFLPEDPLLLEAETWVDQRTMRFYPDVWRPQGIDTPLPNLLLMQNLARSWIARGDGAVALDAALADYRRAIRLGRLLRQEDAAALTDMVGLRCIEDGLAAMARRLREAGDERGADRVTLAQYDTLVQRLLASQTLQSFDVDPYLRLSWFGARLDVPAWKLDQIASAATQDPARRFRREATSILCQIRWAGTGAQRKRATEVLEEIGRSEDPLLTAEAACAVDPFRAGWIAWPD